MLSVQGDNGICVSLSDNMYTICADTAWLCSMLSGIAGTDISVKGDHGICVSLSDSTYTVCADYT